jgi:cytochrome P450
MVAPENLGFGHGHHACPGRFFASNEIKLVLVDTLRRFDLSLQKDGGVGERPELFQSDIYFIPDPSVKVYYKKRGGT